jgi:hypothetical protein
LPSPAIRMCSDPKARFVRRVSPEVRHPAGVLTMRNLEIQCPLAAPSIGAEAARGLGPNTATFPAAAASRARIVDSFQCFLCARESLPALIERLLVLGLRDARVETAAKGSAIAVIRNRGAALELWPHGAIENHRIDAAWSFMASSTERWSSRNSGSCAFYSTLS